MGANPNGISSSGQSCPDRFKLDQPPVTVSPGRRRTASNCNPVLWRDPLLRRSVCAAGQPAHPQVSGCMGLSVSDRDFPALTGRSGTQRHGGSGQPRRLPRWRPGARHHPVSYALRGCSHALLTGSKPALASCSQVAAGGDRWLLMVARGHGSVVRWLVPVV